MTTPIWQSATTDQLPKADHVNQFLVPHKVQVIYPALQKSAQTTAGAGSTNTNGTYLAQSFTTAVGQTQVGFAQLIINTTGGFTGLLPPTTLSLYADSAGAPSGSALVSTRVAAEYVASAPSEVTFPLPVSGLTASTTYWLVVAAAGDASHFYNWSRSNQVSGASTSPDGTTWTAQAYGFLYRVFDQTISDSDPLCTWEDDGVRWTWTDRNVNGTIITFAEYTLGQTATTYTQTYRSFNYTSGLLTTVV